MDWILMLILVVAAFMVIEFAKHLVVKNISKLILIGFVFFLLFFVFSYFVADFDIFKESKIVMTGHAIADDIIQNVDINTEGVSDKVTDTIVNTTLKTNKLFKG